LEKLFLADLGTVYDVMSSKCNAHKALITWFIGYWEDEGFEDHELSIFKHDRDSFVELLREGERSERAIL
jgi:hypothetical protein